jgi:hypothetical protein
MSKLLILAALVTAAVAAHPADAGEHHIQRVALRDVAWGRLAKGNVADVFNSQGNVEAIECWVRADVNGMDGFCYARDEKGRTLQCVVTDEPILRAVAAIGPDSTIEFGVAAREGRCGVITVTNGSYHGPKRPTTPDSDPSAVDLTGVVMQ